MRSLLRPTILLLLFLTTVAIPAKGEERIRLYAMTSYVAGHAGQLFLMGSQEKVEFQISLGHEAGNAPVSLPETPSELFKVQLSVISNESLSTIGDLDSTWSALPTLYSITGETVESDLADPAQVAPGAGRQWRLELRRTSGESFGPGHYALTVELKPDAVVLPSEDPWLGRWTGVRTAFEIREIVDADDQKLSLRLEGYRAQSEGRIDDALAHFEALQLMDPLACTPLAMLQIQLEQFQAALDCFALLPSEVDPHSTLPLYRAFAHMAIGEIATAQSLLLDYTGDPSHADSLMARFQGKLNESPPTAKLNVVCDGLTCTFDARGSSDDYGIVRYRWQFGDGSSTLESSDPMVRHTYSQEGEYNVTLTVIDGSQLEDSTQERTDMIDVIDLVLYLSTDS